MLTITYEEYIKTVDDAISFVNEQFSKEITLGERSPNDQIRIDEPLIKSEIEHIIFDPTDPDRIVIQCQSQQWIADMSCTEYLYKGFYRYCIQYDYDESLDLTESPVELDNRGFVVDRLTGLRFPRGVVWNKEQLHRTDRTFEVLTLVVQRIQNNASDEDKVFIGLNGDYTIHISYD